jgi:hypothetical protein
MLSYCNLSYISIYSYAKIHKINMNFFIKNIKFDSEHSWTIFCCTPELLGLKICIWSNTIHIVVLFIAAL